MKMVIDELITLLGLDLAPGVLPKIKQFETLLSNVSRTVSGVSASLVGAASGALAFATKANNSSFALHRLSQFSGLSTDELQQWEAAVISAGGEAGEASNNIADLNNQFNPALPESYNTALIQMAVKTGEQGKFIRNASDAVKEFHRLSQKLPKNEASQFGRMIGLSEGMIGLAMLPDFYERIEKSKKSAFKITPEQAFAAAKFKENWGAALYNIEQLGKIVSSVAAPAMEALLGDFGRWFLEKGGKELIESRLQYTLDGIIKGFRDFGSIVSSAKEEMNSFFDKMKSQFPGFSEAGETLSKFNLVALATKTALIGISVGLTAMGISFLWANKWIAIITLLITLLSDLFNYFTGKESFTGPAIKAINDFFDSFEKNYPKINGAIKLVKEWLVEMDKVKEKEREGKTNQGFFGELLEGNGGRAVDSLLHWMASDKNKRVMEAAKPWLSNEKRMQPMASHTITINQTINGGSAMGIAHDASHGIMDLIDQRYPGMFTQVAN